MTSLFQLVSHTIKTGIIPHSYFRKQARTMKRSMSGSSSRGASSRKRIHNPRTSDKELMDAFKEQCARIKDLNLERKHIVEPDEYEETRIELGNTIIGLEKDEKEDKDNGDAVDPTVMNMAKDNLAHFLGRHMPSDPDSFETTYEAFASEWIELLQQIRWRQMNTTFEYEVGIIPEDEIPRICLMHCPVKGSALFVQAGAEDAVDLEKCPTKGCPICYKDRKARRMSMGNIERAAGSD